MYAHLLITHRGHSSDPLSAPITATLRRDRSRLQLPAVPAFGPMEQLLLLVEHVLLAELCELSVHV